MQKGREGSRDGLIPVRDADSGLHAWICIDSTARGPAFGGIRRRDYPSGEEAVADARRLAEGMSLKCAAVDLPAGGAKTVVQAGAVRDRAAAYRALGRRIEAFEGQYVCGPDVGTTDEDLDQLRAVTRWVNPRGNDAGAATARGVLAGLRGTLQALDGDPSFDGRVFVVQGLGTVGRAVADRLLEDGGKVFGADLDEAAVRASGVQPVGPARALATPCDVFVPCALGGVLTDGSAAGLPARAVCGSANNQVASPSAASVLHGRGLLYAPDFMVNAGAVTRGSTRSGTGRRTPCGPRRPGTSTASRG